VAVVSALEYGPKRSGRCREPRAAAGGAGECPSSTTFQSIEQQRMQRSHWHSECSDCSECSICWGNRKCQPRQQLQGGAAILRL